MSSYRVVARQRLDVVNAVIRQMLTGARPIVAAVDGGAYGLGLALAGACELVVAGRSATFCTSFAKIGLASDSGLSYTLPLRVRRDRPRELLLTARTVDTAEAERIGLIERVVDDGAAVEQAVGLAAGLAELSAPMPASVRQIIHHPRSKPRESARGWGLHEGGLLAGREYAVGRAALAHRRPDFVNA